MKKGKEILFSPKYEEVEEQVEKKLKEKLLTLLYEARFIETLVFEHLREHRVLVMDSILAESMIYNRKTADTIIRQF